MPRALVEGWLWFTPMPSRTLTLDVVRWKWSVDMTAPDLLPSMVSRFTFDVVQNPISD